MPTLTMPQLGESVTEGTILQWLKEPGDQVGLDEPIVEVETEKVTVEIPSPFAGTLSAVLVAAGETVDVGTALAEIGESGAASTAAENAAASKPPDAIPTPTPTAAPAAATPPATPSADRADRNARRFSPAVMRLADEHGIDPSTLTGSGAGGRVTRKDVLAFVAGEPPAAARDAAPTPETTPAPAAPAAAAASSGAAQFDEVVTFSPIRRRIAANMVKSKQTAPHAWLVMEADVTEMVRLRARARDEFRRREGADLTYLSFVARAVCQALHAFPIVNATWSGEELIQRHAVNLGVAVDAEEGLIVPVVRDADHLTVGALATSIADVAARARTRKLKLDEVQGGTFTIDNTGVFGTVMSAPIINYPQVAILTTEAVIKRPIVLDNDAIAVRSMMNICLSFDHRAMDGSTAAGFAVHVRDALAAVGPDTSLY
jgi:2-oxoisovalerate dehydrogenase E2 component (dihydrolipoyl transacylase)